MNNLLITIEDLKFEKLSNDVQMAKVDFNVCEAIVFYYKKGYRIPKHHHSEDTLKVILKGEILINGTERGYIGSLYACKQQEGYMIDFVEDTYLLLLQKSGTKRINE
jgi:hypothetical protein